MTGLVAHLASCHATMLEFTEFPRVNYSFRNVCSSSLHVCMFILYTYGHGNAWNTWIQWLRWVLLFVCCWLTDSDGQFQESFPQDCSIPSLFHRNNGWVISTAESRNQVLLIKFHQSSASVTTSIKRGVLAVWSIQVCSHTMTQEFLLLNSCESFIFHKMFQCAYTQSLGE